jgi:hypothetical protein
MDVGRAFAYVFQDRRWGEKLLIAIALNFVPIVGQFFVRGYFVELLRRVAEGEPYPLPEWDNFGDKLIKGFLLSVIQFVYLLPLAIPVFVTVVLFTLAGNTYYDAEAAAEWVVGSGFLCVSLLYLLAYWYFLPAIVAQYALTGSFGAAFHLGEILETVRRGVGNYFVVMAMGIVTAIISPLGFIACGIGVLFTSMYASLISYHLYGQAYRRSRLGPGV